VKRSPMPARKAPLRSRTRLAQVNRKRQAKRLAQDFGRQACLARMLPCAVCVPWDDSRVEAFDLARVSDPHHEPPRSAGGHDSDVMPLCRAHHQERHDIGRPAFEAKYAVDLRAIARRIHEALHG
jgi:hypothetical protein